MNMPENDSENFLLNALSPTEPLGPDNHFRIKDDVAEDLLYHKAPQFGVTNSKPHMIWIGRKGAGKSALLSEIRLGVRRNARRAGRRENEHPVDGGDYIVEVGSYAHFHEMVRNVNRLVQDELLLDGMIQTDYLRDLWYRIFWDEIIMSLHGISREPINRERLAGVQRYVHVDGSLDKPTGAHAREIFEDAKNTVLAFLRKTRSRLYFLLDTLEEYPVRNIKFMKIQSGLLQGLQMLNDESAHIIPTIFIPEELEGVLIEGSSNVMKDLSTSFKLRWKPVDLIRIVAHRMRVSSRFYDRKLYADSHNLDFAARDDLHKFYSMIFPKTLINSQGLHEDPLAYVIRHTQLLPRHVLAIVNRILALHYADHRCFRGVLDETVRAGVTQQQKYISEQILKLPKFLYPKLLSQCETILPDLDPICDFKALQRAEGRFGRLIEEDVGHIWNKLFEIGILGRSTSAAGTEDHSVSQDDRYCYGEFHFNIEGAFAMASDGEYCFHPVFSRAFGMKRRGEDRRVVYPANIDLKNLYAA